jgi:hypothetical protein
VDPASGSYDLQVLPFPSSTDEAFSVGGLPNDIVAHQAYSFTLSLPPTLTVGSRGHLVLGLPVLPRVVEVPLVAEHRFYLPLVFLQ